MRPRYKSTVGRLTKKLLYIASWSAILLFVVVIGLDVGSSLWRHWQRPNAVRRGVVHALWHIRTAEHQWHQDDPDKNGKDYTGDLSILPYLSGPNAGPQLQQLADADDQGEAKPAALGFVGRHGEGARRGYLFHAIRIRGKDGARYADPGVRRTDFALCAYPARYETGGFGRTYILDASGEVYEKDLGATGPYPIDVFPADPAAEGWEPVGESP